eukprot:UN24218
MPTISRIGIEPENHFIHIALESLREEVEAGLSESVHVIVYNVQNDGTPNHAFEAAKAKFDKINWIDFEKRLDPDKDEFGTKDAGNANKPGWKIRKQSRDLVSLMNYVSDKGEHFMFMEDDFPLCKGGLKTIIYAIHKTYIR